MPFTKKCAFCGNDFTSNWSGRKVCSRNCGFESRRKRMGESRRSYIRDGIGYITLNYGMTALVDVEDFANVTKYNWRRYKGRYTFYAATKINNKPIAMHRFILGLTDPKILADHKNGNGLDNRRENLRECGYEGNARNRKMNNNNKRVSSLYKGVCKTKFGRWSARIKFNKKDIWLGAFLDEKEAAIAYDNAAKKYYGEFAYLNFPENEFPEPISAIAESFSKGQ